MASGECNCGAISFEVDARLSDVFICHCSICRRSTGANGIAVVIVPNGSFRWTRGEEHIACWKKPDANWETWFCSRCGSRVPGNDSPDNMFIPAGCISSGGESLKVAHHVWVNSRAGWDVISDRGVQHLERYRGDTP